MSKTKRGRRGGGRLPKIDALQILSAALNTCADSGLAWHVATNTAGGLVIILPEATVTDDGRRLLPKAATPAPAAGL